MKNLLLLNLFFFIFLNVNAQVDKEPLPDANSEIIKIKSGNSIYGKVTDIESNKGIAAASVQLFAQVPVGNSTELKDSLIAAMLTRSNGDFVFQNLLPFEQLHLVVSAVGYAEANKVIPFADSASLAASEIVQQDVGNVIMSRESQRLEGITIVAEAPALKMGIDKKIFDVDKSLTSKGGTAIDVMKNIPSVSVDVDGNVELRNSAPTIFIDGRPTILTLDQVPADNIDRIELITNPSAKYDASSTGGIINIILKKNKRKGINGLVSATVATPESFSSNANLNLRQGKLNFFLSGNYNTSNNESNGESFRENRRDGITQDYFNQYSTNNRKREFTSIRFGFDYFIDLRNTITLSQGFVRGRFNNNEDQEQKYLNNSKVLERYGDRVSTGDFGFNRNNSQFIYTHKFPTEGKELNARMNLNYGDVNDNSAIVNTFYNVDGSLFEQPNYVRNHGANDNNQMTANIDFTNPFDEDRKLETGLRSYINNYTSYFNSFSLENGDETKLPLSNNYKYTEMVNAAYITYTGKLGSIGYQAGLRGEYSKFTGTLIDSSRKFGYEYPSKISNLWDALFPSLYLSKKLNDNNDEIQLNYSRRVRRPNFWQLNPFIDINDPLNIQQGNPELKPEFRNSMEFNYSKNFKNNSNFLGVIYYRNTQGDITRYSDTLSATQYKQLENAAVDPNAILNTFINSRSNNRVGLELTLQEKISQNFDFTPSFNLAYSKVNSDVDNLNLSNEGFNWSAELTANYKIRTTNESSVFNKIGFQLNGEYESPRVLPQGRRLEQFSADFAMKKDVFKNNKGTITFSINDVFDTQKYGVIYDTETFYQESYRRRRPRSFRLSFSYKFGNSDFSLFKSNQENRNNNQDD
jgi:outer membrane receptor protein involved in Fe transport